MFTYIEWLNGCCFHSTFDTLIVSQCIKQHQQQSTDQKTVVNEGRTAMQDMHTTTIMRHNERMLAATAATDKWCIIFLPFALFCHRRSRWCKTFLYFVRLVSFFYDVRPPAVTVGCRYVIVRRTTMAYWATAGFYVCRISTVVWATGRVTCT